MLAIFAHSVLFKVRSHFLNKKNPLTKCFLLTKLDLNVKNIIKVINFTYNQKVNGVYVYRNIFSYLVSDGEKKMEVHSLLVHHVTPYSY